MVKAEKPFENDKLLQLETDNARIQCPLHAIDTVSVNKISDSEYEITFTGQQVDGDVDQLVGDVSRLSDGDPIRLFEYERDAWAACSVSPKRKDDTITAGIDRTSDQFL